MYSFLKSRKQFIWNKNIPEISCLCEVCENICLFARGINKNLKLSLPVDPHTLVEENSCDSTNVSCMTGACESSKEPPNWSAFEEENSLSSSDSACDSEEEISFFKWVKIDKKVTKAQMTVSKAEAWEEWCSSVEPLKSHIHRKRKQYEYYNDLKRNLTKNECLIQVDYSASYCNKQHGEIQSALAMQISLFLLRVVISGRKLAKNLPKSSLQLLVKLTISRALLRTLASQKLSST